MRIEVEQLKESGTPFTRTYAADELQLEDEDARLVGETHITGRAAKKREQVRVQGTINASVEVPCDRCVAAVTVPLSANFDVTYAPALELLADDAEATELQEEDLSVATYEGGAIDIDELVREQALLALPLRQLCRAECRGLCLTCGLDLNTHACHCERETTDPRWSALAALKDNANSET